MYNFFSNKTKQRAFLKALKEVEKEGFYLNLTADEDAIAVLPDLSRAVASLGKKSTAEKVNSEDTIDISEFERPIKPVPQPERTFGEDDIYDYDQSSKEPSTPIETGFKKYNSLFESSPTFLDGEETTNDFDLLSGVKRRRERVRKDYTTTVSSQLEVEKSKHSAFERLAERQRQLRAEADQREVEPPLVDNNDDETTEEVPHIKVEVVAAPDPVPKKKKAKKKPKKNKKRRKFDADIAGGFDF